METIANSLQKTIQDNFRKLNMVGMASTPEVLCSCSLFKPYGEVLSTPYDSKTDSVKDDVQKNIIVSQFIPGEKNDGKLSHTDPGNAPFILPQGMTPDDIMMEQARAIKDLVNEAEDKVKELDKTKQVSTTSIVSQGGNIVTTTTLPGESTTVSITSPVPTTPNAEANIEMYAPFVYDDDVTKSIVRDDVNIYEVGKKYEKSLSQKDSPLSSSPCKCISKHQQSQIQHDALDNNTIKKMFKYFFNDMKTSLVIYGVIAFIIIYFFM